MGVAASAVTVTGWADQPMLAFDIESTGTDPEQARIVTACLTLLNGSQPPTVRTWLVDPGIDIPSEATAVHGVTTEKAQADGVHPSLAISAITAGLRTAWSAAVPVVIMNASYDLTVLDRELRRHMGVDLGEVGPVIDPMVIDRALDKWRRGKRTLTDLCATYQVKLEGAHTAGGDCIAAARVAWRLAQVYPEKVGALSVQDLHTAQQSWRADWAADFEAYLRGQGKVEPVDGAWPVRKAAA